MQESKEKRNKPSFKVLIVCYDFYPEAKPNTYRWFNIAKKWSENGAEVYVVTANKNEYVSFEEIDGVKIYRTTEYFFGNLKYNFRGRIRDSQIAKNNRSNGVRSLVKRVIRKIYDLTWSNLYWPDHCFLWKFSAVNMASNIIAEHNIDKLITVSWPFSSHQIGFKLKKKFKNLYWLADTIDPFSFNAKVNNTRLYGKLNISYELKVFKSADLNSVLTQRIKEKYISMFPGVKDKIVVNNNVFIPTSKIYSKCSKEISVGGKIRIVFLGTLSLDTRSPENSLILFDNLIAKFPDLKFRIDFFGDFTDTIVIFEKYPHLMNTSIFLHDFINRDEVNKVISNADILLNIGNNNAYQEPSKLIEYMYSMKKILNICTISEDTSAPLLRIYPLSLSIFPDEISCEVLEKVIDFFNSTATIEEESLKIILKDYLLDTVANKYLSFISRDI